MLVPRGGELEVDSVEDGNLQTEQSEDLKTTTTTATASALSPTIVGKAMIAVTFIGKIYSQQLELRPILTKSYTAALIFGLSDFFAQKIERSNDVNGSGSKMDWTRTIASTLVGLLYFGPAAHYWYEWIFRLLPGTTLLSTLYKAFWGQGKI